MKNIFSSLRSSVHQPLAVKHEALAARSLDSENKEASSLTVIELFQSQGCSSCPPANANVIKLTEDPSLLVLTYEVTYWDRLGWRDTFGDYSFDQRQWEYARGLNRKNVFTPQVSFYPIRIRFLQDLRIFGKVIVNGRVDGVGNDTKELKSLITKSTQRSSKNLSVIPLNGSVTITGDENQRGVASIVRYDPRVHEVSIPRGENGGRKLPHKNVVRNVTILGSYHGGSQSFSLSNFHDDDLKAAILVQDGPGGSIIGAARV